MFLLNDPLQVLRSGWRRTTAANVDSHFQKILHQDGTVLERAADKINQWTDTAVNAVADGVGDVWDWLSGKDEEREHKLLEGETSG
ncbi:MAG: hypothetical protein KME03_05595 [Aphanocapsa lilacina HA4352-LM1]|jgi:hypothetical protein|nr:hypothetical protein [Aphanocapsa lilacina HA4352-LM1]